jgi:chitin synthase
VRSFVDQVLRLSARTRHEIKVAEQIKALGSLLDAFGNAKTLINPNASRHSRYLELHFNDRGRISSAKVLTFGLDKSRLNRLSHEERSFHIFYQFLAGATSQERDHWNLEDPSDYALLASSGCYRLPSGPFSDDATAMVDLRAHMRTLGFKPKHMSAIFSILIAILSLSNLHFAEADAHDVSAYITNTEALDHAARLLGVVPEELSQILTNKTNYVRKELYTILLNAEQSAVQRDRFVRDLYAILFAFIVETANHKISPGPTSPPPHTQILILDESGFQARGQVGLGSMLLTNSTPLVSVYGHSGFDEFCINFADEVLHSYAIRSIFEDDAGYNRHIIADGIPLPAISTMDNSGCIELLRGTQWTDKAHRKPSGILGVLSKACSAFKSGKGGDRRDEELLQDLVAKFGVHASFVASSNAPVPERGTFGINHYAGTVSYDISNFVERDMDLLDSAFVSLLRNSSNVFVSKLFAGPSLAAEKHSKDEHTIVQAQVSTRPLRAPTPLPPLGDTLPEECPRLDPGKTFPVTTQVNYSLFEIFSNLDRARLWTISCIRPNDSGSPNSFDKRRVKSQIRSLLLADVVSRRSVEYIADFSHRDFCDRYVPTMRGSEAERMAQCARANGWREGLDYVVGHNNVWLSYPAWKMVEDSLRAAEKQMSGEGIDDEENEVPDDNTDYTHQESAAHRGYFNESADNLLTMRHGTQELNAHSFYASGGLPTPNLQGVVDPDDGNVWGSAWDSKEGRGSAIPSSSIPSKEANGLVVHQAPNAVEEVPSSKSRRMWLWVVWGMTWWIPSFLLRIIGRMKRPDIRLAWREKTTIFVLIFVLNAIVIFYIIEFGRLLCPNFDKAWSANEVAQHTGTNDFWVSIHGQVYDVSNFVNGDHSDIPGIPSNGADTLEVLAGQDLTGYFPPPLVLACSGLVNNDQVALTPANFTPLIPSAMHISGALQSFQNTELDNDDWYTDNFLPEIQKFYKGPLVLDNGMIASGVTDPNTPRSFLYLS